jgi:hypothetical protein
LKSQQINQLLDSDMDRFQEFTATLRLRASEELAGMVLQTKKALFVAQTCLRPSLFDAETRPLNWV